jgi:hypothetical protein
MYACSRILDVPEYQLGNSMALSFALDRVPKVVYAIFVFRSLMPASRSKSPKSKIEYQNLLAKSECFGFRL